MTFGKKQILGFAGAAGLAMAAAFAAVVGFSQPDNLNEVRAFSIWQGLNRDRAPADRIPYEVVASQMIPGYEVLENGDIVPSATIDGYFEEEKKKPPTFSALQADGDDIIPSNE